MAAIRFGLVGAGRMTARMIEAMRLSTAAEPVRLASSDPARGAAFAASHGVAAAGSLGDLLADPGVEAVYVANRNRDHEATALAALAAGKHVLVEKPAALSPDGVARLVAASRTAGRLFVEGLWCLHLPAWRSLIDAARDARHGQALGLHAEFGHRTPQDAHPSLYEADGGVVLDRLVYPASLAVAALGPGRLVGAQVVRSAQGLPIHATAVLDCNGALATLAASFVAETGNLATLSAERAALRVGPPLVGAETVETRHGVPPNTGGGEGRAPGAGGLAARLKRSPLLRRARAARPAAFLPWGADAYGPEIADVAACIAAGRTESAVATHAISLETARILHAVAHGTADRGATA